MLRKGMKPRPIAGEMRCDLHVHTIHSGMCTVPIANRFCRESFTDPQAVYEKLKRLGMDLVTITDHDSIEAAEALRRHPDFFLSEEATCRMPSGTEVHMGIYDITERQHVEIQRRRADFHSLLAYLREQDLFFTANHAFSALTGKRALPDYVWFARAFPGVEIRNGTLPQAVNDAAVTFARRLGKAVMGGSDAHCLNGAGAVWTSVPGAQSKREFLDALRAGRATVEGESGSWWNLTRIVWSICLCMVRERPWTVSLAPAIAAVPLATALIWRNDERFSREWLRRVEALGPILSNFEDSDIAERAA
jgi:predicted metal-dependent phosphoesterase TrpH